MRTNFGLGDTTSLYCGVNTTSSTIDSDSRIDIDKLSTTATGIGTTLSATGVNDIHIQLAATRNYVSQMSIEEIDTLLLQLDDREEFILEEENVKVKTIGSKKI